METMDKKELYDFVARPTRKCRILVVGDVIAVHRLSA